jgi:hypothetical protein
VCGGAGQGAAPRLRGNRPEPKKPERFRPVKKRTAVVCYALHGRNYHQEAINKRKHQDSLLTENDTFFSASTFASSVPYVLQGFFTSNKFIYEAVPKYQILELQPIKRAVLQPVGRETARTGDKITDFGTSSHNIIYMYLTGVRRNCLKLLTE